MTLFFSWGGGIGLTTTKNKRYYENIITCIFRLFKLVLFFLKKIVLLRQYFHNKVYTVSYYWFLFGPTSGIIIIIFIYH